MEEKVATAANETESKGTNVEEIWKTHVEAAKNFPGSNVEYCRRNGLNLNSFRAYKRKFGAMKPRNPRAFVKVECLSPEPVERQPEEPLRPGESSLPDPRWMAEFIAAFLAAQK